MYQEALERAGHRHILTFKGISNEAEINPETPQGLNDTSNTQIQRGYNPTERSKRKNRHRNVIWYNPPFNDAAKTDIGKVFLRLIHKHFDNNPELKKLFNKNNVKVSYSCGRNVKQDIQGHNKHILKTKLKEKQERTRQLNGVQRRHTKLCSCPRGALCPVGAECFVSNIIYKLNEHPNNCINKRTEL